jgi:hypothetical protein
MAAGSTSGDAPACLRLTAGGRELYSEVFSLEVDGMFRFLETFLRFPRLIFCTAWETVG